MDYTPEHVARGLRDLIAWETRHKPTVDTWELGNGGIEFRVFLNAAVQEEHPTYEQRLREILPDGYALKVNWT